MFGTLWWWFEWIFSGTFFGIRPCGIILFEVHHWVHFVSVFLQGCILTLFDLHPQTLVQNNFAFLQLQRRFVHPVEHEHKMISWQAFGIGSCVIRSGWSLLSAIFFHPNVSGSWRWGSEQWACFHTIAWWWAHLTCSDKASLVGGSASGFPFFENKIAQVNWSNAIQFVHFANKFLDFFHLYFG